MDGSGIPREEGLSEKDLLRIIYSALELLNKKGFQTDLGDVFNVDAYQDKDGEGARVEFFLNYNPDEMSGNIQIGYYVDQKTGIDYRDFRIEFQVVDFDIKRLERFLKK